MAEYGVRFTEFNRNNELVTRQRFFKTAKGREAFLVKLEQKDNFNEVTALTRDGEAEPESATVAADPEPAPVATESSLLEEILDQHAGDPEVRQPEPVQLDELAETQRQLLPLIRAHAITYYDRNGWDILTECWTDEDILRELGRTRTMNGAVLKLSTILCVMADQRSEIENA